MADLGCGDGRLAALVLDARPEVRDVVALDCSPPMLDRARARFAADGRVAVVDADMADPLPVTGPFDAVVSGFAIHHLAHERKRSLLGEIAGLLRPGGVLANLEVVECASPTLQDAFLRRIGRPGGDPEDVLAPVGPQLVDAGGGLVDVDCQWRWRGFAPLVGARPGARS